MALRAHCSVCRVHFVEERLKKRNQDEEHEVAECCSDGGGTFLDEAVGRFYST